MDADKTFQLSFDISEEDYAFKMEVRDFARSEIIPLAGEIDGTDQIPMELRKKIFAKGWNGILWPKEYGGMGGSILKFCMASEEIAYASAGVGASFNASTLCGVPLLLEGTVEQKKRFAPPMIRGDYVGGSIGITEPHAGSDVSSLATRAVKQGGYYILNGQKAHIDNVGAGNLFIIFAVTDPNARPAHRGFSTFIVERQQGVTTAITPYMGLKGLACGTIDLKDCKIGVDHLLGQEGHGFYHVMRLLEVARTGAGGFSVGIGQACLDETIDYATKRVQFKEPIVNFQIIQNMIGDMAMELELMRMLAYRAAKIGDMGLKADRAVTAAKLFCGDAVFRIANKALQIHGGNGYSEKFPAERHFRDARVVSIGEGTHQMMNLLLAKIAINEWREENEVLDRAA
jgi:alkylation response protein AidB-like acyl-CoA dehydrogenase